MFLLIDECCGKALVAVGTAQGHAVQRTVEVAGLGPGAPDPLIFDFARRTGAVVVTINQGDFIDLSTTAGTHPGLILLPSLRGAALARLFGAGLPAAAALIGCDQAVTVRIEADGSASVV